MTVRTRKILGVLAVPLWIAIYALLVMSLGGHFIVGSGVLAELAFYVVAGLSWMPVAMLIIRWMTKPDAG